jgi:PAS domain S-box-containing protein
MLAPLRNAQGNVIQLVASAIDISDRRAGEEALYRSEERFRHVFEGAPDGIAMVDSHGRMVLVNGAMERLFGYSRSEMVGHSIELLIPQRYLPNHHQWRTAYMQEPTTRDMAGRKELYARRKDNSEFAAEIGLNPLRLPDGVFVLATVFDVTKRRADQQTIERALLEKTALLNEVHHRVKNNLQVISSLLNLQSRHAPPEARQLLTESQGRVKAMALIHQLLYERHDYSRVNLAYYLGRLGALLTDSFTEQRGRIVIEQHFDGNETTIDLQRAVPCGLIVNELVTNALKHAFPDGRSGRISISLEQADNGYCRIIVADDGVGLPDAIQLDNATSLGFQLVPLLADQLGGQLSIERTQGTRFILSIPPSTGEDQ